jgi:hypothetical protein
MWRKIRVAVFFVLAAFAAVCSLEVNQYLHYTLKYNGLHENLIAAFLWKAEVALLLPVMVFLWLGLSDLFKSRRINMVLEAVFAAIFLILFLFGYVLVQTPAANTIIIPARYAPLVVFGLLLLPLGLCAYCAGRAKDFYLEYYFWQRVMRIMRGDGQSDPLPEEKAGSKEGD